MESFIIYLSFITYKIRMCLLIFMIELSMLCSRGEILLLLFTRRILGCSPCFVIYWVYFYNFFCLSNLILVCVHQIHEWSNKTQFMDFHFRSGQRGT